VLDSRDAFIDGQEFGDIPAPEQQCSLGLHHTPPALAYEMN
jgi:hypothetical protein